ncbi:MAG: urea ABC transporter permease subunit UrtB, partial [Maritimibacter sp.]|nr:urea ABC transporter permease subunit UrtB [Maritimibacter sp.]
MNRLHRLLAACLLTLLLPAAVMAQETEELSEIQALLQEHREIIEDSSRRTIGPAIDAIAASGIPAAQDVLERWQARELWQRTDDGLFFFTEDAGEDADGEDLLTLIDIATGDDVGTALEDDMDQLRPNSGIQRMMAAALVRFQLTDPSVIVRTEALDAIARSPEESHLAVMRDAIEQEENAAIRQRMDRLSRLLTIQFAESDAERIEAIESFAGDLSLDVRATLNPLVQTRLEVAEGAAPEGEQVARVLRPGSEALSKADAYALLVEDELAPPLISGDDQKAALVANIADGQVAGIQVADLNTDDARDLAYAELVRQGAVEAAATEDEIDEIIEGYAFYEVYTATSPEVVAAALGALRAIDRTVAIHQFLDLTLDALSLASIYFLAAIGLAITFGVMRVINMAHGEFIMMGAYTGYVVQQFIPNYTASIAVAIPLAFLVTFSAGVAMERLVIRWLYHRPLETLLATFGISIALQQLAKNIFGTQARPLTSPDWLGGALVFNDVVSISYIRVAIFVLALIFLGVFLFIMNRTRVGLEVRAVTQNPRMAASMGINPDKINMLTFGL